MRFLFNNRLRFDKFSFFIVLLVFTSSVNTYGQIYNTFQQPISLGTLSVAPDPSSILDIKSSSKGVLIPRMTTFERISITNPSVGLLVFDSNFKSFWYYDLNNWVELGQSSISNLISDIDLDTQINVEESSDSDNISFTINGNKHLVMKENSDGTSNLSFPSNSSNMFIGALSGSLNDVSAGAVRNTFIGYFAGKNNISGLNNTFVGRASGALFQSGQNNTFYGVSSGQNLVIGNSNVFIGSSVGSHLNTPSNNNTLVGANAGASFRYTDWNTMLGSNAGRDGGQDGYNVFIGARSGEVSDETSGNVFIGFSSGKYELNDNRLYIENTISNIPLIYGEFDTDKVGINWDADIALPNELTVNGEASKSIAGDWLANSDGRLKKNISTLDSKSMLEKLISMRGVSYEWDDDRTGFKRPSGTQYGFIAQELKEVWPSKVQEDKQGYLQASYGTYDHMYVEAIKQLNTENILLKEELANLKKELGQLTGMVSKLNQIIDSSVSTKE